MMRWLKAGIAAVALLAIIVVPPGLLVSLIGNPWPAEGVSLYAPLTDGAIIGLIAVLMWILWLQVMACLLAEAIALLTADRTQWQPPLVFGVQQQLARRLITAVVVGGAVAGPMGVSSTAFATPAASLPVSHQSTPAATESDADDQIRTGKKVAEGASPTATITVQPLDSLWSIAEEHLGDGTRWAQIAELNDGDLMNDGRVFRSHEVIQPGWQLRVPAVNRPVPPDQSTRVTIAPGDTLSGIAAEHMSDADGWRKLYRANQRVLGPDPDTIHPGHRLVIPVGTTATGHVDQGRTGEERAERVPEPQRGTDKVQTPSGDAVRKDHANPPWSSLFAAGAGASSQEKTPGARADNGTPVTADGSLLDEDGGISTLDALLASAVCLSAGALGLLLYNRRRQWRQRRAGRIIASTPDELVEVEQSIIEHGILAQKDAEFLDRALRYVAASCKVADVPLPLLGAAVLGEEDLTLLFTRPAETDVPAGWTATDDARAWMLPRWTILEDELENQPPPYPTLVSVGLDEGGHTWYLDLETLGMCGLGGDPQQVADLARFMVAELAVSEWAEGCEVLLADEFASETVRLNPARLRQVGRSDALARAAVLTGEMAEGEQNLDADVLTRRRDGLLLDTTNPVVVVVSSRPTDEFATDIETRDRSRVVVLHGDEESPAVELSGDGMAFLPMWGISVKAFTMQAEDAAPMADLFESTRNLNDEPIPAMASDEGPLGKYARADGSLREEYTAPRRTEGNDASSMLPEADEVYLATAATTPEDLAAAAPSVPAEVRAGLEALDPTLDRDVADWFDPASPRPKVHLLGPVEVNALNGGDRSAIDNLGGTIAFIAYLAVQDHGVTGERAAAACGWKTQKTVQNRATNARFLLGTRPDGSDWLPDASLSAGALRGTSPTYELVRDPGGVLISGDLFIRLKNRAERRGDNGCEEDLVKALSLVTGAPFEAATETRFKWLFRAGQQRHDEILVGAVHDAAHVLATRAVSDGRTDLVRLACDAARKASPHSDIAWLDQAAATEAESGRAAAGELVREQVLDRFDEDLPARSESIVEQREWGATG